MYTRSTISGSGEHKVVHVEIVYSYSSAVTVSEMGGNITWFFHGGKVRVSFIGHKIYIKSWVYIADKIISNTYQKSVGNNALFSTNPMSGCLYYDTYTKLQSWYNAILTVTRIGVPQLTVDYAATVGIILGEVVEYEEDEILVIEPKAIVLAEGAATVLLGDLLLLYGWASILQGPKIYIAEGLSYEMQWYNFFKIGVYGE